MFSILTPRYTKQTLDEGGTVLQMATFLFRMWVVLTAVWLLFVSFNPAALTFDPSAIFNHLSVAATPPLIILGIGAGLLWAARGFRA